MHHRYQDWGILCLGGLCPGGSLPRGLCLGGSLVQVGLCPGGLCMGVSLQGESLSKGGLCLGVSVWGVSVWVVLCRGGLLGRPLWKETPMYGNERAVRIILECIFV